MVIFGLIYILIGFFVAYILRKIFSNFLLIRTNTRTIFLNAFGIFITQIVLIIVTENFTDLNRDLGSIFYSVPMSVTAIGSGVITFIFFVVEGLAKLRIVFSKGSPNSIWNKKVF